MRRLAYVTAMLTMALSSCNSFNTTMILRGEGTPSSITATPSVQVLGDLKQSGPADDGVPKCPVFTPPKLPDVPDLPYKELQEAANSRVKDPKDAVNDVVSNHILVLRLYAHDVVKLENDAYAKYLDDCKRDAKK